jgi:hypothetical protein
VCGPKCCLKKILEQGPYPVNEKGQQNYPSVAKPCTFVALTRELPSSCATKKTRSANRELTAVVRSPGPSHPPSLVCEPALFGNPPLFGPLDASIPLSFRGTRLHEARKTGKRSAQVAQVTFGNPGFCTQPRRSGSGESGIRYLLEHQRRWHASRGKKDRSFDSRTSLGDSTRPGRLGAAASRCPRSACPCHAHHAC